MAQRARLKLGGLVVKRRRSRSVAEGGRRVALQAKHVHVAEFEHVRVGRAVGHMAGGATLSFYRRVFENKGPVLVDVALEANRILAGGRAHLLGGNGSVRIVAIAALHEPFVHAVMKRHIELRLLLQVAGVAKLGLCFHEQKFLGLCMMRRVTGDAAHVILAVQRVDRIHVLGTAGMAGETAFVDLFGGMIGEDEDFRFVASAGNVGGTGTVTSFASLV